MLRQLLIGFVLIFSATSVYAQSGDRIAIGEFHAVNSRGNIHLVVDQKDSNSTMYVEYINLKSKDFKYQVRKGVLYLDVPSGLLDGGGFVRVTISSAHIEKINCEGATIECKTPIKGDYFEYSTEGSANLAMLNVDVDRLIINTIGKSDVMVVGGAREVNLKAKGGSRIDAFKLRCTSAVAESYDGSEIYVCPTQTLKAKASLAGTIYYMGTQAVEPKVSLWGDVILIERMKYKPLFINIPDAKTTKSEEKEIREPAPKPVEKPTEKQVEHKVEKRQPAKKSKTIESQTTPETSSDGDFF